MKTVDKKISELMAAAVEELGCTVMRVAVNGLTVDVDARWERDLSIVGTMRVRVPVGNPNAKSVLEKFVGLPDGEYVGVA